MFPCKNANSNAYLVTTALYEQYSAHQLTRSITERRIVTACVSYEIMKAKL